MNVLDIHVTMQCVYMYMATNQGQLKIHKLAIHEGVKYLCNQCEYQATQQTYFKTQKQVKHECKQCEYQATQQTHLKTHKQSIHTYILMQPVRLSDKNKEIS